MSGVVLGSVVPVAKCLRLGLSTERKLYTFKTMYFGENIPVFTCRTASYYFQAITRRENFKITVFLLFEDSRLMCCTQKTSSDFYKKDC